MREVENALGETGSPSGMRRARRPTASPGGLPEEVAHLLVYASLPGLGAVGVEPPLPVLLDEAVVLAHALGKSGERDVNELEIIPLEDGDVTLESVNDVAHGYAGGSQVPQGS